MGELGLGEFAIGEIRMTKDMEKVIYLGRYDYMEALHIGWRRVKEPRESKKLHIFINEDGKYWTQKGFTKLAEKLTEEPVDGFSDMLETYLQGQHYNKLVRCVIEKDDKKVVLTERYTDTCILYDNTCYEVDIYNNDDDITCRVSRKLALTESGLPTINHLPWNYKNEFSIDIDQVNAQRVKIVAELENGKKVTIKD
jgi:hypothetical protein